MIRGFRLGKKAILVKWASLAHWGFKSDLAGALGFLFSKKYTAEAFTGTYNQNKSISCYLELVEKRSEYGWRAESESCSYVPRSSSEDSYITRYDGLHVLKMLVHFSLQMNETQNITGAVEKYWITSLAQWKNMAFFPACSWSWGSPPAKLKNLKGLSGPAFSYTPPHPPIFCSPKFHPLPPQCFSKIARNSFTRRYFMTIWEMTK